MWKKSIQMMWKNMLIKNKHYKHVEKKRKKMIKKREEKNIEFIHKP